MWAQISFHENGIPLLIMIRIRSGGDASLIGLIRLIAAGWHYVLSPSYRFKKHREWRKIAGTTGVIYGVASRLLAFGFSLLIPITAWLVTHY